MALRSNSRTRSEYCAFRYWILGPGVRLEKSDIGLQLRFPQCRLRIVVDGEIPLVVDEFHREWQVIVVRHFRRLKQNLTS